MPIDLSVVTKFCPPFGGVAIFTMYHKTGVGSAENWMRVGKSGNQRKVVNIESNYVVNIYSC